MEINGFEEVSSTTECGLRDIFFCFAPTTSDVGVGLSRRRDDDDGAVGE
jgi:hypothetical protein